MESFTLDKAKGTLTRCNTAKTKSKDDEGKRVLTNDVHLLLLVDERCKDAADFLFPNYEKNEHGVAGRDGEHLGLELHTKGCVPELNVTIYDGGGQDEVWSFQRIKLNGKPKLLINSVGDSRLVLRLDARLSKRDMGKLVDFIDADIYVSAVVPQPNLPGLSEADKRKLDEESPPDEPLDPAPPAQQNLDGSMTSTELRGLRETAGWSRADLISHLDSKGVNVSPKSLQRYEAGDRPIPSGLADAARQVSA